MACAIFGSAARRQGIPTAISNFICQIGRHITCLIRARQHKTVGVLQKLLAYKRRPGVPAIGHEGTFARRVVPTFRRQLHSAKCHSIAQNRRCVGLSSHSILSVSLAVAQHEADNPTQASSAVEVLHRQQDASICTTDAMPSSLTFRMLHCPTRGTLLSVPNWYTLVPDVDSNLTTRGVAHYGR